MTYRQGTSKYFMRVFMVCVFLLPVGIIFSQINKLDERNLEETMRNPWKPDRSVFLQDWLILGSIPIKAIEEIDTDFLTENNGEANIQPVDSQTVKVTGSELKWVRVKCRDILDLQRFFQGGRNEDALAYAYTIIKRNEAGKVYLTMGTDDGVKVWLNGKMVHRVLRQRGLTLDEDKVEVDLQAGENRLLLKIQQGKGGWGFAVRLLENANQFNTITGNIEFSLVNIRLVEKTLTVFSESNLDQSLLKQVVQMKVYTTGGKSVDQKTFNCSEPIVLSFKDWIDGVYEFRFLYKDIRGIETFKYLTWYKGDILAAARAIVNSAPGKDVRTPNASTHRMLAEMILNRLQNNMQNPDSAKFSSLHAPIMEFLEIGAKKQIRPNGFIRLAYIDDIDNTPQFCRCYLPLNYDPSKKWPMVVYLHGFYDNFPEYINLWDVNKRHESASDKQGVIFIEPHGRENTQYLGIGDRDVLRCIEMAKQKFNVDNDRIYLMGSSMGGFGTWNVATRHPELFAAIAPIYGSGDFHVLNSKESIEKMSAWELFLNDKSSSSAQLEALVNMPILVSHGDRDQSVDVNLSRYVVRMLQRWNYDVRYIEVPEKGHTDLGIWNQIVGWLLQHKRSVNPHLVRVRAGDLKTASAYWVKVTQRENPTDFIVVDAEVLEGNMIRVDSRNALELEISPGEPSVNYSKLITVSWNGKIFKLNSLTGKKIILKDEGYTPVPIHKTASISGPIADFQTTPFLIVTGSISGDSLVIKLINQKAGLIINNWKANQKYEPRLKKDIDVTEDDMKKYSLLLLGGPQHNQVSKLIFEKLPFKIVSDTIQIADKSFKAKDAVFDAIYPNPMNPERYVDIVASTSNKGYSFYDNQRRDMFQYDFYIADGKIPNFSMRAKNEKILIASGFFNYNWKPDSRYLSLGDDTLRSKCASVSVNSDLSVKIVSALQPTIEMLQSYTGTYQVLNGPAVRIFLVRDILKATQGPNDEFSVQLLPTSDTEFYIKELNISVGFRKGTATNVYSMIVYQNGQEYTSQKIK